ncbi:flagellar export protein FliJ [Candidatus Saccharibacteria bacterium]|nr:flagellar export protein FliJ [Candidatus Saccharibacteria bacterium]|tara:strand:+ start:12740 stop:13177 length:438 start_codon:yes stop_codon:yes gene_type:complete
MDAYSLLLDMRKKDVEQAAQEVSTVKSQIEKAKAQISTMENYLLEIKKKATSSAVGGTFGDKVVGYSNYIEKIRGGVSQQKHRLDILLKQAEFAHQRWIGKIMEMKKVEKLIATRSRKQNEAQARSEQKAFDELSVRFALSKEDD